MTITYHAGRRIQGLSTDTIETPSLDYNFPNTTNWTSADSFTDGTISSNKLNYTGDSSTNSSLSFDMENATTGIGETVSDTAWVLRFGLQIVSWVNASSDKVRLGIGMSSADSSTGYSSAQDHICINLQADNDGSERVYTDWANNNSMESNQVRTSSDFTATQYYVELIRTSSSTFTMQFYSDSDYTTTVSGINASRTGITDVTGLRYFVVKNYTDASTDGNIVLKISDLQFWNGVSSLTSKPTNVQSGSRFEETDTRKIYYGALPSVTFEDDFSSYADQTAFDASWVTSNTAKFRGNPSNDNVDILTSNSYDNIYYDLTSVSDTKWLCRFKVTLTTAGSQSLGICYFYIGTTIGDANESQSGLGFYFYDNNNNTYATADNGNRPDQTSVVDDLGINPSTTTYYAEMKRTSATSFTVTLYSDSSYSTSLGTATLTISSGITGLRYFKIMGYNTTGGLVGTLDDFKFYNGATSTDFTWTEEV